jgi:hypothetical protein
MENRKEKKGNKEEEEEKKLISNLKHSQRQYSV